MRCCGNFSHLVILIHHSSFLIRHSSFLKVKANKLERIIHAPSFESTCTSIRIDLHIRTLSLERLYVCVIRSRPNNEVLYIHSRIPPYNLSLTTKAFSPTLPSLYQSPSANAFSSLIRHLAHAHVKKVLQAPTL